MTEIQNRLNANASDGAIVRGTNGLDEHPLYSLSMRHWRPVVDVLGGQPRLQALSSRYLPQQQGERDSDYLIRTERAVLENYYAHGIHTLSTAPFSQPVVLRADSALPQAWQEDVDGGGSTLTEFAENALREVLTYGVAHIGVFLPAFDGVPSIFDYEQRRLAPYFRLLPTLNVYDWLTNRREQVEEIREVQYHYDREHALQATVLYYDARGFKELRVKRGQGNVKDVLADDPDDVPYMPYSANEELTLSGPPIVQCYASQPQAPMIGRPPFADCAAVNIEIYSQQNARNHYLHTAMTRWQVLKEVNLKEVQRAEREKRQAEASTERNVLSSTTDVQTSQRILIGKDGDVFYVGPDTSAAEPISNSIREMIDYVQGRFAGQVSAQPMPNVTATQTLLGTVAARAAVRSAVQNVDDALTKACRLAYRLLDREPPSNLAVTIDRSFEETMLLNPSGNRADPPDPPNSPADPPEGE